ncbi:MAG: terminase TerL endonuclease subunit [Pseudomonadota bacterium]
MADYPHVDRANQYAKDIVAKKIPACKWIKLACKRHLADLVKAKKKSYPYRFDETKAEKVCKFIELLPHTKGVWASKSEKIRLESWQCFKTAALFGWVRKHDNLRRFRKALILEPRKNAKSTWAAGVGLYMLTADGEHGAEVYSGATTEKQAWEVFRPARLMALKTPALQSAYGVHINASNLHILGNESRFEPIIGKPGDGASPSCSIVDEYHEHDTDDLVDTMETGMGAREQPLSLIITTAGDNLAGPCYAAMQDAQRMLEGVNQNDELFALIYTVDDKDDWTSEVALRKANPNYDISVKGEFLLARQREAINNARKVGTFKTKHLNLWVQARSAYFNIQRWHESAVPGIKLEDFAKQPCRIGLDLAAKVDIAALEIVFKLDRCNCPVADKLVARGFEYARFGKYFLPEATIDQGENEHYRGWQIDGWVSQTDGDMIDYIEVKDTILDLVANHQVEEVAYDPHQAMMMVSELMAQGVPVIEVRPLVLNFSEPMKQMDGLIRSRKTAHNGDPVYTWMLSNVVAKPDKKDNVYPNKDRAENKIDGPVAHMMALARFMANGVSSSIFDREELWKTEDVAVQAQ